MRIISHVSSLEHDCVLPTQGSSLVEHFPKNTSTYFKILPSFGVYKEMNLPGNKSLSHVQPLDIVA